MRILIQHRTDYRYSQPLIQSVQYVRLTPRSGNSQTVNRWKLTCQGADLPSGRITTAISATRS